MHGFLTSGRTVRFDRPPERVTDFPGGATRWIVRADGIEHVLVNGVVLIDAGAETNARPGRVV